MAELYKSISNYLLNSGRESCIAKAKEFGSNQAINRNLHFRNLDLSSTDVLELARIIERCNLENNIKIESISFSYNKITDEGLKYLLRHIPNSISEIGLVNCGITNHGIEELINWLTNTNNSINMICVEQNNISESWKKKFQEIRETKPYLSIYI